MKLSAKTALFLAVYLITAKVVFAQITVDLDVLTEDFIPKDTITLSPQGKEQEKKPAASLKAPKEQPRKKTVQKPVVAKKPVVQKPVLPKKPRSPAQKQEKQSTLKKYQVKETAQKDEHDRLKPRAKPVPEVKILAADNTVKPAEQTAQADETASVVLTEPKISKHFLEQERLKQQQNTGKDDLSFSLDQNDQTRSQNAEESKKVVLPLLTAQEKPQTILSIKEKISDQKKITYQAPPPVKFSVFYVPGKLTPKERSDFLSKEIPSDSDTRKALTNDRKLLHIFIFEDKSNRLSDEMQTALDEVAETLKKNRNKRLILYSYSAADPAEPGKERQYALRRSLMIRSYLTQKGVHSLRIEIRSCGKKGAGSKIPNRTDILIEDK